MDRKTARYERIFQQLKDLLATTSNRVSCMSTIAALLHHKMDGFFWTGFYLLQDGHLLVGPYQGPLACQELEKNRGVCWKSINDGNTIIVPDVQKFPGYIACDARSQSEIAVPLYDETGKIIGVLDVDSKISGHFNEIDAFGLEKIVKLISSAPR